jgi:hypothetical protein
MDALREQSNIVDTFISEHTTVLAPARRILPEILSEIFFWCLSDGILRSAKDAPIVLGQVCSYWRSVVSTPKLWSSLSLYINRGNVQSSTWLLNIALCKSAACPLTIYLTITSGVGGRGDVNSCFDVIFNHSRRWKSVCFDLPSRMLRKLSAVKHALPMIEALDMWDDPDDPGVVLDAFEVAPRLRSLRTDMSPRCLKVPGEQLEYFDGSGLGQRDCLEWLHRCSNLIDCSVTICGDVGLPSSVVMARLPRLVKLKIMWESEADLFAPGDLFNGLVTSALSALCIQYEYAGLTGWPQLPFVSFLSRSACALRKLHLTDIPITDVQLIECLCILPSLVELIIDYDGIDSMLHPVTDMLFQRLIYRPPNLRSLPLLSPQLQAITFEGHFMVDGQTFGDMVASRWRIHGDMGVDDSIFEIARLKSVTWRYNRNLDGETRARLEQYKEEGLELYISKSDYL